MIPDKAKDLAEIHGWNRPKPKSIAGMLFEVTALDPSFWQALGKALGWPHCPLPLGTENDMYPHKHSNACQVYVSQAFRFYDYILTGQSTDEFWKELLSTLKE